MKILGIDPGLATVGIGLIEIHGSSRQPNVLDWLTITTAKGLSISERLVEIATDLESYIKQETPDIAVIERLFFAANKKTAIDVAHARGVVVLTAQRCGLPIIEPTPLQLKTTITGDGRADKRQMQDMLMRTLKLTELPKPDDAADALALALYGAYAGKLKIENGKWKIENYSQILPTSV